MCPIRTARRACRPALPAAAVVLAAAVLPLPAPLAADLFALRPQTLYPVTEASSSFAPRRFGATLAAGDFNGDGNDDLVVGAPGSWVTPPGGAIVEEAGSVHVFLAGSSRFDQMGHRRFDQEDLGGDPEPFDHFGEVLAVGDFDADGFDDLAVGGPGENLEGPPLLLDAGTIHVVYGSASGLDDSRTQTATSSDLGAAAAGNDHFGAALAAGDFNGDSRDDLAIGVPERAVGASGDAGWVIVAFGSAAGLDLANREQIHQDVSGVLGVAAADERFGAALAAGNFGGVGPDDLAVGIPEDTASGVASGSIAVFYGKSDGLLPPTGNQLLHEGTPGVADEPEADDLFGAALVAVDGSGDLLDDLIVGVPGEDVTLTSTTVNAGRLHFFRGDPGGFLTVTGNAAILHPCECGCTGMNGFFGSVLAAGDVDGDPLEDLVVGVPTANWGATRSGSLCGIYGDGGRQPIHQALPGLFLLNENEDRYGSSVAIGARGGRRYVAAGIPFEEVPGQETDEGVVLVLYDALFADGLESGDTAAWSSAVP
jgi:hypothetical protein